MTISSVLERLGLTIQQKKVVIDEFERSRREGKALNQASLAQWAFTAFGLPVCPSQPTISKIIRKASQIKDTQNNGSVRFRNGLCIPMEHALLSWIHRRFHDRIAINGQMVGTAGKYILRMMNSKLSTEQQVSMKFSKGWLHRFEKRYKLRSLQSYGESGDVPVAVVQNALGPSREVLLLYSLHDCFNADEFGLFYKMAPDRTIGVQRLPGRKRRKRASIFLHVQMQQASSGFLFWC